MALDPSTRYPAQIDADTDYPYGKARNVAVDGDGTGTPLEKDWVNDLFGFQQKLLDEAGITPSGNPDSVAASDYFDALDTLMRSGIPGKATTYRLVVPLTPRFNLSSRFTFANDYNQASQTNITDGGELDFAVPLPASGKITAIHAVVTGANQSGVGHSALPANLPVLQLRTKDITVGNANAATTTVANQTDGSGSAAAYNLIHLISATGLNHTISQNKNYSVVFVGEFGANSEADKLNLLEIYLTITPV